MFSILPRGSCSPNFDQGRGGASISSGRAALWDNAVDTRWRSLQGKLQTPDNDLRQTMRTHVLCISPPEDTASRVAATTDNEQQLQYISCISVFFFVVCLCAPLICSKFNIWLIWKPVFLTNANSVRQDNLKQQVNIAENVFRQCMSRNVTLQHQEALSSCLTERWSTFEGVMFDALSASCFFQCLQQWQLLLLSQCSGDCGILPGPGAVVRSGEACATGMLRIQHQTRLKYI